MPPVEAAKKDWFGWVRDFFGPVFWFEVVRVGRRNSTFALRFVYLLLLCLVFYIAYQGWSENLRYPGSWMRRPPRLSDYSAFGTILFTSFIILQYAVIILLTPATMAGTIAVEKERKTLEFMLATDLSNREIIFGKLIARFLGLMTYLLCGLPILGIALMFGGIDPNQLLGAYAATILSVIGMSGLSVFFSCRQKRARDAIALTYLVATLYVVITVFGGFYIKFALPRVLLAPPMIGNYEIPLAGIANWLNAGNPIYATMHATGPAMMRATVTMEDLAIRFTLFHLGFAALTVGWAILRLRKIAQKEAEGGAIRKKKNGKEKTQPDKPEIGSNPILWRELFCEQKRRNRGQSLAWALLAALVFVWPLLLFLSEFTKFDFGPGFISTMWFRINTRWENYVESISVWVRITTGAVGFILMMTAALRGAGAITAEKDKDTWISLQATPVSPQEFLLGKWLGCVLGMRPVIIMLLLVWVLGLFLGAIQPVMVPILLLYLAVYLSTFALAGIFCSITARNTVVATIRSLILAVFLSGGHFLFGGLCCLWPMSWGPSGTGNRELSGQVASFFAAHVPAFILGWLPLPDFEKRSMGLYHPDAYRSMGVIAPMMALGMWIGLNIFAVPIILKGIATAMNRRITIPKTVKAKAGDEPGLRRRKIDLDDED